MDAVRGNTILLKVSLDFRHQACRATKQVMSVWAPNQVDQQRAVDTTFAIVVFTDLVHRTWFAVGDMHSNA